MQKIKRSFLFIFVSLFFSLTLASEEKQSYTINFHNVPVVEFIQFVSRISNINFIFDHQDLQFNISLASGKSVSSEQIVKALTQILLTHGMIVSEEDGYLVIHKFQKDDPLSHFHDQQSAFSSNGEGLMASLHSGIPYLPNGTEAKPRFLVYKLKYHTGDEIEDTVKKITADLMTKPETSPRYLKVLKSVQWIKPTNSLIFSGDEESLKNVQQLIDSLDTALSQVFIEVLVVETDTRNTSDFGLQWSPGGKYQASIAGGNTPTPSPLGHSFDMGLIGNLIWHKGCSYFSLAPLVSALQTDRDTNIILNQKIITQDNKASTLFVGDNIPFTGAIVSTMGTNQQTTANLEYKDVGVKLEIIPRLGDGDIVTLQINQDISEAVSTDLHSVSASHVSGIQTTKTNMATHAHVPDGCFFVLSGTARNAKRHYKDGIPCLGGIPILGSLFGQSRKYEEKRNIIIFVRPHIVRSIEDYQRITQQQERLTASQEDPVVGFVKE